MADRDPSRQLAPSSNLRSDGSSNTIRQPIYIPPGPFTPLQVSKSTITLPSIAAYMPSPPPPPPHHHQLQPSSGYISYSIPTPNSISSPGSADTPTPTSTSRLLSSASASPQVSLQPQPPPPPPPPPQSISSQHPHPPTSAQYQQSAQAVQTIPTSLPAKREADSNLQLPQSKKKTHFKSRTGCFVCKRRKIKCDEARPRCKNCTKHGASCKYADDDNRSASPSNDLGYAGADVSSASLLASLPIPLFNAPDDPSSVPTAQAELNMQHLSLMVHFFARVLPQLTRFQNPKNREMWMHEAPASACRFPFLMYANLAIVCSHIIVTATCPPILADGETESPEDRNHRRSARRHYETLCAYYRQRAFELFRTAISGDTNDLELLRAALFASVILSLDGFSYPEGSSVLSDLEEDSANGDKKGARGRVVDAREQKIVSIDLWLPLHFGIGAFLREFTSRGISHSEIHESWQMNWDILPLGKPYFKYLNTLIEQQYDAATVEDCKQAINILERILTLQMSAEAALNTPNPSSAATENWIVMTTGGSIGRYLLAWPYKCPPSYLQRLREHDIPSLIVYLHFLSIMRVTLCPQNWWAMVTTRQDILAIVAALPGVFGDGGGSGSSGGGGSHGRERWKEWYEWPKAHLDFDICMEVG
ncbi:hypothetical protein BZA70DRAFT_113786 [Myxozyma melibiosi]|uniref:Zn(2)-C6 fungal-type domain-containing protein n=1 Tax=Myxozyma melibiosi TaxID=54550 RepID=A0ABR1FAA8_9ASCO